MKYVLGIAMLLLVGCDRAPSLTPNQSQNTEISRDAQSAATAAENSRDETPSLPDEQYDKPADSAREIPSESDFTDGESQTLANLPDGRYTLVSQSKRISNSEDYDHQRLYLEKSGRSVVGSLAFYLDDNPCFEGTVAGDRIVDIQFVSTPYAGSSWDGPGAADLVIEGSEYSVGPETDKRDNVDYCKEGFALLRTPTDELGKSIAKVPALLQSEDGVGSATINVRDRPSLSASVIDTGASGTLVYLSREAEDESGYGDRWYYVSFSDGEQAGWVHSLLLDTGVAE
ncbi:MAG: SH3 domain-containing protein [Phormidesmis sp.]